MTIHASSQLTLQGHMGSPLPENMGGPYPYCMRTMFSYIAHTMWLKGLVASNRATPTPQELGLRADVTSRLATFSPPKRVPRVRYVFYKTPAAIHGH
jgi:hypothetical protein